MWMEQLFAPFIWTHLIRMIFPEVRTSMKNRSNMIIFQLVGSALTPQLAHMTKKLAGTAAAKEKKVAPKTKKAVKSSKEKKPAASGPKVKRPLSSYTFYFMEARKDLVKKNPSMSVAEVGKKVGELWRAKSIKDRESYIQLAARDKKRYESEKAKA
eukprot:GHVO01038937.1.p1 GENE.GHVO01038937.1~~GHVO01038937.1.p1  ORF type:complete len:156 (+),score=23.09 GHVO01038937.1:173-640(+)